MLSHADALKRTLNCVFSERCGRRDMDAMMFGDMRARSKSSDVKTWRYGVLEARYRCRDVEVRRCGDLQARCRCSDAQEWR